MKKSLYRLLSQFLVAAVSAVTVFEMYIPTAIAETTPTAPTILSAAPQSASSIKVYWKDNATNEKGFYVALSNTGPGEQDFELPIQIGPSTALTGLDSGPTNYTVTNLSGDTDYWFKVAAYNDAGTSDYVVMQQPVKTPSAGIPANPAQFSITNVTATSVGLRWYDQATNEEGFYVSASTDGVNFTQTHYVDRSVKVISLQQGYINYVFSGLSSNTPYWFKVKAYTDGGKKASGEVKTTNSVSTLALPTPLAPTNVSASQPTATSLKVSWTDNATNETWFLIAKSTDGTNFDAPITVGSSNDLGGVNSGAVSFTFTDLAPNTTYWFKVAAKGDGQLSVGTSAYATSPNGATTLPPVPSVPNAPTNITAAQPTATSLMISWTDNATNEDGFYLAKSTDGVNFDASITVAKSTVLNGLNTGVVFYTVGGLQANTQYWFKVATFNIGGVSAYATTAGSARTLTLPSQISSISAIAESSSHIRVSWQGTAIQYLVTNVTNGTNSGWQNSASYTFGGLTCGTTYTFEVVGKDAAGTLTVPISASTATQACGVQPPPPPPPAVCPTLVPGNLIKVIGAPAIYALDDMLRYRYFADGDVFKSWNADDTYSGKYIPVTGECLRSLSGPDQPPFHVFYRPGSYLVKYLANPDRLYVVQPNRVLVPISVTAANGLYGSSLVNSAKTIGLSEWPFYTKTATEITTVKAHPGMLVKVNNRTWYVTEVSKLREVTTAGMTANRFKPSFVHMVPASAVAGYDTGSAIVDYESALSDRLAP